MQAASRAAAVSTAPEADPAKGPAAPGCDGNHVEPSAVWEGIAEEREDDGKDRRAGCSPSACSSAAPDSSSPPSAAAVAEVVPTRQ